VTIPLHGPAANLDAGREGLESGHGHHAAGDALASPPEGLVQLGGVKAVQPHELPGHHERVAVDDFGGAGEATDPPAEREDGSEAGREAYQHSSNCALPDLLPLEYARIGL
jgi:hypothetical protein